MKTEFEEKNTSNMKQKATEVLNEIVDVVLIYRPKPKTRLAKRRETERKKVERENRIRESSI